jgi:hypothetical protein
VDHAEQGTDWELAADRQPWVELFPCPAVHSDLSPLATLPAPDEHCAAGSVEVAPLKRERFADPQSGAPQQDDQRAEPVTVGAVIDRAHDRDDLFDRRRICRVLLALVAWRAPYVIAGHGRWRAAVSGDIQQHGFHESPFWDSLTLRCYSNRQAEPATWKHYRFQRLLSRCPRVKGSRGARGELRRAHSRSSAGLGC